MLSIHVKGSRQIELFDFGWRFHRGDAQRAEKAGYDDSGWRRVDVPHDWSIEDLPPLEGKGFRGKILDLSRGKWRWMKGDNRKWSSPDLNESRWEEGDLPRHIHPAIGPLEPKSYGWYRRKIVIPRTLKGKKVAVYLGKADDVDETFFNGVRIGGHGKFPPKYEGVYYKHRLYEVPAKLVRWGAENSVAVRIYCGREKGGLFIGAGRGRSGPFDSESPGGPGTGHAVGGIGWYRKRFTIPAAARGRRFHLDFDGVYMNSEVWLNGIRLGENPYGYTPFWFDITKHLKFGGENVVAVKVRNIGANCRWYSGSGIYRHVNLTSTAPVSVAHWGVYVRTLKAGRGFAIVRCETAVENQSRGSVKAVLVSRVVDASGRTAAEARKPLSLRRGGRVTVRQDIRVPRPRLWSPDSPDLYCMESGILVDGTEVDEKKTSFGIRVITFDAKRGCRLNGKRIFLKGGCMHHDNGPLGARAYERADERRVEIMKKNGYNAVRTSHNPVSSGFLDACDRLGFLVIEEAFDQWRKGSREHDYHNFFDKWWKSDVDAFVLRDRSRPSIIMWSIGNEIGEQATDEGLRTAKMLAGRIRALDPSRAITQGVNSRAPSWRHLDRLFGVLDVCGYNYKRDQYVKDHGLFPKRVMYASESFSYGAKDFWDDVKKHPWVVGDFAWTGYDYIGEAKIGWNPDWVYAYPWTVAYCGEIDLCGNKTPASFYKDAVWNKGDHLSLFVHFPKNRFDVPVGGGWSWPGVLDSWNWDGREGKPLKVVAYTNCDRVELKLNGRSVGSKKISPVNKLTAEWEVPYEPGVLKAVGYRGGRKTAESELRTAGKPKAIRLSADRKRIRADGHDLCYVDVEILDGKGRRHPQAGNLVRFRIKGAGTLAAVGSAKPDSVESFQRPRRRAWEGRCQAIIRSRQGKTGPIRLTAYSKGIKSAVVMIEAW